MIDGEVEIPSSNACATYAAKQFGEYLKKIHSMCASSRG